MPGLNELIAKAAALGGEDVCADGHAWEIEGYRPCPTHNVVCSQTVYRCRRCGEYDYGDDDEGPGAIECRDVCGDSMEGWREPPEQIDYDD